MTRSIRCPTCKQPSRAHPVKRNKVTEAGELIRFRVCPVGHEFETKERVVPDRCGE